MTSIKFDTTEICNATYIPRFCKHETIPARELNFLQLAREDGAVLISERYGVKHIFIMGKLTAASRSALDTAIDSFKELFSRKEENLDIEWEAGTRRYVATCVRHEFNRDFYNNLFVPWTAEFVVLSGEGKATTATKALDEEEENVTGVPAYDSFEMIGSKGAKPIITVEIYNDPSNAKGIEFSNEDTGEKIIITENEAWADGDQIKIYCDEKRVTKNLFSLGGLEEVTDFYGVFPKFKIGTNNFKITAGGITYIGIEPTIGQTGLSRLDATTDRIAQSFEISHDDDTFQGVAAYMYKHGSPGIMTLRIETDDEGKPSGNLVDSDATFTIAAGSVSESTGWINANGAAVFTLSSNTKYWLVMSAAGVDGSNFYGISYNSSSTSYPKGNGAISVDSGANWTDELTKDYNVRIRFGGTNQASYVKLTVEYYQTYL